MKLLSADNLEPLKQEIVFRDGTRLCIETKDDLFFLLNSTYFADKFLPDNIVVFTVKRLYSLSASIRHELINDWVGERKGLGGWPGTKEILLYLVIRKYFPDTVLETGVAQGVSSRFILQAMEDNNHGNLVSIDLPNYDQEGQINQDGVVDGVYVRKDLGVGWVVPENLRKRWKLILGDSKIEMEKLNLRPDLFFHDSDHSYNHMMYEYNWGLENVTPGGLIVSDDIGWNKSFSDFMEQNKARIKQVYSRHNVGIARIIP